MDNKERLFPTKLVAILLLVLLIVSLVPLIINGFFDFPSADDYIIGLLPHNAWVETGNFFEVLKAAAWKAANYWYVAQGTLSAIFLIALQPGIFGEQFYFLVPIIMLFMIIGPSFWLIQTMVTKVCRSKWEHGIIVGVPLVFLCLQHMPSIAEGLFWFPGAALYTFFYGVMMLLLSIVVRLYTNDGIQRKRRFPLVLQTSLLVLLGLIVGFSNYASALLLVLLLAGIFLLSFLSKKDMRLKVALGFCFISALTGLILNAASPGSAARAARLNKSGILDTFTNSFAKTVDFCLDWTTVEVLLITFMLIPIFFLLAKKSKMNFRYPLLIVAACFCLLWVQSTPTFYTMSQVGPYRMQNIIYFSYIWLFWISVFYSVGWIARAMEKQGVHPEKVSRRYSQAILATSFVILLAFMYVSRTTMASYVCYRDLKTGASQQYALEMNQRYEIYHDKTIKDAVVKPFTQKPQAMFFADLGTDKTHWINTGTATYYGKDSIVVEVPKETTDATSK